MPSDINYEEKTMKKRFYFLSSLSLMLSFVLSGCFIIKVNLGPEEQPLEEQVIEGTGADKIVLMDVTGVISSEGGGALLGVSREKGMIASVREQLDAARQDEHVKAVVIRINSPGGGVTASDSLYHEIKKYKHDTGAKIVAHLTDTGASGGYYAALAADRITAQPTTITGSIGVTMLRVDATGLMQKIGINAQHISSGPEKSMGSPFRAMTPEEKKIFQTLIDSLYGRFVDLVADERKMAPEHARHLADGRIYTGPEAKEAGLVDGIGYLENAFDLAKKLAGIEKATVVSYLRPGQYRPNIYALNLNLFSVNLQELSKPGMNFTYLWLP
jgi:protease-4